MVGENALHPMQAAGSGDLGLLRPASSGGEERSEEPLPSFNLASRWGMRDGTKSRPGSRPSSKEGKEGRERSGSMQERRVSFSSDIPDTACLPAGTSPAGVARPPSATLPGIHEDRPTGRAQRRGGPERGEGRPPAEGLYQSRDLNRISQDFGFAM